MRSVRRSGTVAAVSAVLAAGLLAGCSAVPGTAAVVDGRTISQSELVTATDQLANVLNGADASTVLLALVLAPDVLAAAAEQGAAISADTAVETMDSIVEQTGGPETEWSDASVLVVRMILAGQTVQGLPGGPEALTAAEEEALSGDVTVNPRYGTLDPEQRRIVPRELPWITEVTGGTTA